MRAMVIRAGADGPVLELQTVPDPVPGPGELLLRVRAAGLNRADLLLRAGHYERIATRPTAAVAGLEAAGEVVATGEGVTGFAAGDRVMGMPSGAYAEQALLHHRLALKVPDGFDWAQAAALPVALFTAHDALVSNGRLQPGDAVLVQGATSGVGLVAVQAARVLGASAVFGTTTSPEKQARLRTLGVDLAIDAREGFADAVLGMTGRRGVDVIVDLVGASAAAGHLACAAVGARWVQVGRVGGAVATIDLNELSRKRLTLVGVTFRTRTVDEFSAVVHSAWRDLGAAVLDGRVVSPVDRSFALEAATDAHALMRANRQFGKLVLLP